MRDFSTLLSFVDSSIISAVPTRYLKSLFFTWVALTTFCAVEMIAKKFLVLLVPSILVLYISPE